MTSTQQKNSRKNYRKSVSLAGEFSNLKSQEFGEMLVEDISFQGLRFATLRPHSLHIGDIVSLYFRLDDAKRTEIRKKAEVRFVQDRHVGVQFVQSVSMDKDLGFYLMN